jgi:hypothetical protein
MHNMTDGGDRIDKRDRARTGTISVLLEGGLGDHLLGMRVLRFAHDRYPAHDIIAYSHSAGHTTPAQIAAMSPFVLRAVPVHQSAAPTTYAEMGRFQNIAAADRELMHSADVFIDAHGEKMLASASMALDVPLFDILAHRPELVVSPQAQSAADDMLAAFGDATFVGLNLTKFGAETVASLTSRITFLIQAVATRASVVVLNFFNSRYDFPHWPEPDRSLRRQRAIDDARALAGLRVAGSQTVPCPDLPLEMVAGLLKRCRYFIGLDNGIKHLAWALGLPHSFFHPEKPELLYAMRWMPDLHRMLRFDCSQDELSSHARSAVAALDLEQANGEANDIDDAPRHRTMGPQTARPIQT